MLKLCMYAVVVFFLVNAPLALSSAPQSAQAQIPYSTMADTDGTVIPTARVEGEVIKHDNRVLTIKTGDQTKEYTISNGVKITRDTAAGDLGKVMPGDKVVLTVNSVSNEVLSIEATSDTLAVWKMVIPIGLVLLVLLLITALFLYKKNKPGEVKTMPTQVQS